MQMSIDILKKYVLNVNVYWYSREVLNVDVYWHS